jgi:hypothetical protein
MRRSSGGDGLARPGPWRFYAHLWGFRNVIADRDGRYIVSSVPANCGPLLAAGPMLLSVLERVATQTAPGSPARETAVQALESFREQEGMTLVDWTAALKNGHLSTGAARDRPGNRGVLRGRDGPKNWRQCRRLISGSVPPASRDAGLGRLNCL